MLDHIEGINLTPDGAKLLGTIQHLVLRQSVRDYLVNQQFRRDVFVKGLRRLVPLNRSEILGLQAFVLTTPPADVPLKVQGGIGQGTLQEHIYRPLLDVLADNNHEPKSMRRITGYDKVKTIPYAHIIEALIALVGSGHVSPARVPTVATRTQTKALNQSIINRSRSAGDINYLASPVSGMGVAVGRLEQLFLLAFSQGKKSAADQADAAWAVLEPQGHRIVREGKTVEKPEDNVAHLRIMAEEFNGKRMQILRALEII